jgi:hypothetical protein
MEYKYVPESFELDADIPSLEDTAIVGRKFEEFPMLMSRSETSENNPQDSGWFIGSFRAPIFIWFGSMTARDPNRLTNIILEGLRLTKQRAILLSG